MLVFRTSFPVRYYETDQMGIVHHSNYVRFFECARNVMMDELGYPIQQCEADGVTIPVVSVECRYKHSLRMGDTATAEARIEAAPLAKLVILQAVYNQNGELCAEGKVTLGFLNKETGHPVRCPEILREIIERGVNEQ